MAPTGESFRRDECGKPIIPLDAAGVFSFGLLIRETEQALLRLFSEGRLSGTTHTCLGQELSQMSVVRALNRADDMIFSNHRNHGHFLTYTGNFRGLIGEVMGRESGVCGGIGGSQHLAFRGFHSNGVQGGMTAIAVGHALALRREMTGKGASGLAAIIIGDGTLGQGLVYESLNLAAIWEVPALFVIENNGIAQTTPTASTTSGTLEGRAEAFGIRHWRLDDAAPDFLERVESVVNETRRSGKPGCLIIDTRRMGPHSKGDDLREDVDLIRARDPLEAVGRRLPESEREECRRNARAFIEDESRAAAGAEPARRLVARASVFRRQASAEHRAAADHQSGPTRTVRSDLNEALGDLLATNNKVVLLGEDLHDPYGGAFKVTAGLSSKFPERVISTPISEAGIVGAAIGLALHGWRPIVEIMFADFITLACDQIVNHAVKFGATFADAETPLVIRTAAGGGRGYGPTHSQMPVALMCAVPGLTVICPNARMSPGALLRNAVSFWPYPTVFLEHKLLYGAKIDSLGYRTVEPSAEDPGAALFPSLLGGDPEPDLTLVAYGGMVEAAEATAQELRNEELAVEILIPSLLAPLPRHTLTGLLANRERILVLEETHLGYGFGSELGASLVENGFAGRFTRVAAPPVPIPAARSLESAVLPDREQIAEAVLRTLDL
jgi:2-oxoisovalerate dehydrogenase E1 component